MPRKKSEPEQQETVSFEESISELQSIVGDLEDGSLPLEDSMKQFERGINLLRSCYHVLEQAEQRIEILTKIRDDGTVATQPFDGGATFEGPTGSDGTGMDASETGRESSLF